MPLPFRALLVAFTALTLVAPSTSAQDAPLVLEIQGGAVVPLGDFASGSGPGEGASAGSSLSLTFARPGSGWRTLYAGFSQHRFGCLDAGCGPGGRYVATGFNVGLRIVPVQGGTVLPWFRVGGITTRVETSDLAASPGSAADAGVSDLGFGLEAGVGILVRFSRTLGWSTSALLSAVDTDLPGGSSLSMRYLSARTGLSLLF